MDHSIFYLRYAEDGVYIRVNSHLGNMLRAEIISALQKKRLSNINIDEVKSAIEKYGREVLIAPPQEEFFLNEEAVVTFDKNFMTAYIKFTKPDGGYLLDENEIMAVLNEAKVVHGIDTELVASLANNHEKPYGEAIAIAQGTPSVDGKDAEMEIHFSVARNKTPTIREDGYVDHRSLNLISVVKKGDVLVTLHPEVAGVPGTNVKGLEIKAKPGKHKVIPKGRNTVLSDDKLLLYASVDGSVEIRNGQIEVVNVMEIKGDVGAATGHVNFPGDVNVTGNVVSSYNISATGSVFVGGVIESSNIEAGGDIVINQGVKGMVSSSGQTCIINAGGSVTAKFIENAVVTAGGSIMADIILHSEVYSNESVIAFGKFGSITGGTVRALRDIACQEIGSKSDVTTITTVLEVGVNPTVRFAMRKLSEEIAALEKKLNEINELIKETMAGSKPSNLNTRQLIRLKGLAAEKRACEEEMAPKQQEYGILLTQAKDTQQGRVHVRKIMRPVTVITIGGMTEVYKTECSSSTFCYKEGAGVTIVPYSYQE